MRKCSRISRLIYKEADGIITDKEKKYLSKHIESCHKCREEYLLVTGILRELKEEENKPLPENFSTALRQKLIEYNLNKTNTVPFLRTKWVNIAVTCCALLGIMTFALSGNLKDIKNENLTESIPDYVTANDTNASANLKMRAFPDDMETAKAESSAMETPIVSIKDKDGNIKAATLRGTNSIKGNEVSAISDYPHPLSRDYSEENTLKLSGKETFYIDGEGKITGIRIFEINSQDELKTHIPYTDNSFTLTKENSGCIIELKITFNDGEGYYSIKI